MHDIHIPILLFFAGAISSFINMMAGGGSMITVGVMILLGIDPSVANGTNRIGVLMGTASGAMAFKSEKFTDIKRSIYLGLCAIPGATIGAYYSVKMDGKLFQQVLAIVMILILISMFLPKKANKAEAIIKTRFLIYPAMFVVGLYGGFIQIGVGFLLMAALRHLMSYDLLRTNMHKVFVVLIYTLPILLVFGLSGKIHWMYAIIMSMGNALGAWLSVKLAVRKGEKVVKIVLAIAIVLMSIKFLISF